MKRKTPQFDFDEWAKLAQQDPAAFEARRKAMLALELAKGTPAQAATARAALERFERDYDGADSTQRMMGAGHVMLESMNALADQMQALGSALDGITKPR